MIKLPNMLMIGSAGRNSGKTELACKLIRKFSCRTDIIGIKVTPVQERDGECPRGGMGCGVCSSLKGNYCITEERDEPPDKDTTRLLDAGAKNVFWLRVLKECLGEGLAALTSIIGNKAVSICESNSLRNVVEPGLFFVVREKNSHTIKASCQDVISHADKIIFSDEQDFDIEMDDIGFIEGKWFIRWLATAIILAGGRSSRMGKDKSMLLVNNKPMIEHIFEQIRPYFSQVLISSNEQKKYAFLGADVIPDKVPDQGPLMGILSCLEVSSHNLNFVVACDVPVINHDFIRKMMREAQMYDGVIPVKEKSKYEPLFGIYRKSMITPIRDTLKTDSRKIIDACSKCKIKYLEIDDAEWYRNLNTMDEYNKYIALNCQ